MYRWLKNMIDAVLPPRCLLCGEILSGENGLCQECFAKINFISHPLCLHCGNPLPSGSSVPSCALCVGDKQNPFRLMRSQVRYDDGSRPLLVGFKFNDRTENAVFLARWLFVAGHDIWKQGADVLVPVPLHKTRLRRRRYNQSALLCRELSLLTGIPVDYTSLVRHKNTRPQVEISGRERLGNVKNAFCLTKNASFAGKRVVIIDDVLTTGATLKECGLTVLSGGAASVDALTVARVVKV